MSDTTVTVVGNLCSEVRLASTPSGVPVASFRMASTVRRVDRSSGQWVDAHTNYLTVVCWRDLAANVASSLFKGDPVVVHGRLRVRSWQKDERSGTSVEVDAVSLGHDLSRGTSAFTRRPRKEAGSGRRPDVVEDMAVALSGVGVPTDGSDAPDQAA